MRVNELESFGVKLFDDPSFTAIPISLPVLRCHVLSRSQLTCITDQESSLRAHSIQLKQGDVGIHKNQSKVVQLL